MNPILNYNGYKIIAAELVAVSPLLTETVNFRDFIVTDRVLYADLFFKGLSAPTRIEQAKQRINSVATPEQETEWDEQVNMAAEDLDTFTAAWEAALNPPTAALNPPTAAEPAAKPAPKPAPKP